MNLAGGIAGAVLAGFLLLPLLGSQRSLALLGLLNVGAGLVLLGDAAGFVDPITGAGMAQALVSAELLAQMLVRRSDTPVLDASLHGQHAARRHVDRLARRGEPGAPGNDVVDLVLSVRLLRVGLTRSEAVQAGAQGGDPEELEVAALVLLREQFADCECAHELLTRNP